MEKITSREEKALNQEKAEEVKEKSLKLRAVNQDDKERAKEVKHSCKEAEAKRKAESLKKKQNA